MLACLLKNCLALTTTNKDSQALLRQYGRKQCAMLTFCSSFHKASGGLVRNRGLASLSALQQQDLSYNETFDKPA